VRRRIAIVSLALFAMTAAPTAVGAASAATPSAAPRLCLAQGLLGAGVCVPALF
jgi:hypothetical protein